MLTVDQLHLFGWITENDLRVLCSKIQEYLTAIVDKEDSCKGNGKFAKQEFEATCRLGWADKDRKLLVISIRDCLSSSQRVISDCRLMTNVEIEMGNSSQVEPLGFLDGLTDWLQEFARLNIANLRCFRKEDPPPSCVMKTSPASNDAPG